MCPLKNNKNGHIKTVLFVISLLVFGFTINGQNFTLSGTVSQNQLKLEDALVYAKGTSYSTQTNEVGYYELKLPPGNYQIVFAFGNTKTVEVNLNESKTVDVDLARAVESLEEVSVQAVRVDADSPITHSNFSKTEIAKRNLGQDIPILMKFLPSVVSTSDAGNGVGYTSIRVRGSDNSRVNVTINGIPYNDQESQGTFWVNLQDFASSTENIQLQRGVGTSTNGSGAFGASVNILTDKYSKEAYTEYNTSYGSFNTWRNNVKFSTGLLNDHFEISGRLSKIESDGYVDRASSDLKSYFLQANYTDDNTLIKALVFGGNEVTYQSWFGVDRETLETDRTFNPAGQFTDEDGNIQFYDNEVDNYSQDHYQLHWNQTLNKNWSSNISLNYTYGRGYFEQFVEDADLSFHEIGPIEVGNETIENSDLIRRRWLDNDYYVVNANINYTDDEWDFTAGAFGSLYDGDHFGEVIWSRFAGNSLIRDRYYNGNGTKREFTTFAKATWRIDDQWQIYGDVQGRFVNFEMSGLTSDKVNLVVDESFEFFNPKAGITFRANQNHQLYFSFGRAHREPRRQDFENGITQAERLDDFELGWRFQTANSSINTNVYYMKYEDQLVLTGALDDVGNPIRETSGQSYRLGLEVEGQFKLSEKVSIQPNIALSTNKNQDFVAPLNGELVNLGDTNISFSPEIVAGNQLSFQPIPEFQINFLSKYVGEQYMGNIDSAASKLDDFFVNDLNLVYRLKNISVFDEIVFTGLINNVFDAEYESNGYFFFFESADENGNPTTVEGAGFYPQAGVNVLIGASFRF
ncbi:MAG: TonB-dependent receptor [Psychroflexus sp.]|nr:TonB-dependent receptor [Psychroflexus sp.]